MLDYVNLVDGWLVSNEKPYGNRFHSSRPRIPEMLIRSQDSTLGIPQRLLYGTLVSMALYVHPTVANVQSLVTYITMEILG